MQDKFSKNLKDCLKSAYELSQTEKKNYVGLHHFILSLLNKTDFFLNDLLNQQDKKDQEKIKKILQAYKPKIIKNSPIDKNLEKLLIKATILAFKLRHLYVGLEHFLTVMLENLPKSLLPLLKIMPFKSKQLQAQISAVLRGNSRLPEFVSQFSNTNESQTYDDASGFLPINLLEHFATDLTNDKIQKDINPLIKRETEIERLIQILCRKDKNNPIILGDPGVGKTALVEGLAKKILNQEVPNILLNKKILALDIGSIVAGTMYRGDFENRLKAILEEVQNNQNIILFIDEIHNIVGAGSSSGSLDAANLLKPFLARGKLHCIGATTPEEYKKFIEKDPALERRFQPIILNEPTPKEALEILFGIKNNYEKFHQVRFSDAAITTAVEYSHRYISDKLLPDKAIDLIDEAAAKMKIKHNDQPLKRKIFDLNNELNKLKNKKTQAVLDENFTLALKYKIEEKKIKKEILQLQNSLNSDNNFIQIEPQHILDIVAQKTKIPLTELQADEINRLTTIAEKLKNEVIGQNSAIDAVINLLIRAKLGLHDENRPLASMFFLGPSGVGKTYLAKNLAQLLLPNKEAFIKLDMSEYSEKFNISKLIGAPAGYVGYRETSTLSDAVKRHPYSIVLFDEIEKAHPEVINLLLQILEEGELTDAVGKKINFKNTIIIMTSNLGLDISGPTGNIGFGGEEQKNSVERWQSELKKFFRSEFLNRFDEFIYFNNLEVPDLEKIINQQIKKLQLKLKNHGIKLSVSSKKISELAQAAEKIDHGARAVRKVIFENIENAIASQLIKNKNSNIIFN